MKTTHPHQNQRPSGPRLSLGRGLLLRSAAVRVFLVALLSVGFALAAQAAIRTVTNTNDSGPGSLRDAATPFQDGTGPHTVVFSNNTGGGAVNFYDGTPRTITLTSGALLLYDVSAIVGPGANLVAVSGNHATTVFVSSGTITGDVDLSISGLTIKDCGGNSYLGAGIYHEETRLTVRNCVISGNSGPGILTRRGKPFIFDSTISGNLGGGIYCQGFSFDAGTVRLSVFNSTISGNSTSIRNGPVANNGGGIQLNAAAVSITNSTVSDNHTGGSGGGAYIRGDGPGYNLILNSTFSGQLGCGRRR